MFYKVSLLLCFLQLGSAYGVWHDVGKACIGAKDNSFADITYNGPSSFVNAVKLVHTSGYVSNRMSTKKGSLWGDPQRSKSLGILITDDLNRILYPSPRLTTISNYGWYTLPRYTGLSPNLVFSDSGAPQYFEKGNKLRIWYGEDWSGYTEIDNHGNSCMKVFLHLTGC
ncbi:uncharacterized protein LOC114527909 [Dendronephthya gigantea]|uniref:uncharacterized protein LOC114527909 n=1 Tax=Dendronephthya gigantea TaxID=151771 RepID=UPI00106BABC1|nr:uncharacterized protein LOC114527909 [Dendronephthya gigantea]